MSPGIRPLGGYGLTETTSLYSLAPVDDPRPGSAGKSCNGFGGMEAKVSADGELLLRGPAVLKGYYKEPTRTADVLDADGWFRTGDIGRIDAARLTHDHPLVRQESGSGGTGGEAPFHSGHP